jgi:hypothetical protein
MLSLVITLVVIGICLGLLNKYGPTFGLDGKILTIINVVVLICVIVWLLSVFGLFNGFHDVPVPRVH